MLMLGNLLTPMLVRFTLLWLWPTRPRPCSLRPPFKPHWEQFWKVKTTEVTNIWRTLENAPQSQRLKQVCQLCQGRWGDLASKYDFPIKFWWSMINLSMINQWSIIDQNLIIKHLDYVSAKHMLVFNIHSFTSASLWSRNTIPVFPFAMFVVFGQVDFFSFGIWNLCLIFRFLRRFWRILNNIN